VQSKHSRIAMFLDSSRKPETHYGIDLVVYNMEHLLKLGIYEKALFDAYTANNREEVNSSCGLTPYAVYGSKSSPREIKAGRFENAFFCLTQTCATIPRQCCSTRTRPLSIRLDA
jgi:hypothetical protein